MLPLYAKATGRTVDALPDYAGIGRPRRKLAGDSSASLRPDAGQGRLQRPARVDLRVSSLTACRMIVVDGQWCVVAKLDIAEDVGALRLAGDARRRDLIIDPPPDVLRIRLASIAPPRVLLRAWIERAEYVDVTDVVEQLRQPRALFRQTT